METVTFNIIASKDRESIMGFLLVLAEEGRIRLHTRQYDATILPGQPMAAEELNKLIDETERSLSLSTEEFKARLGI